MIKNKIKIIGTLLTFIMLLTIFSALVVTISAVTTLSSPTLNINNGYITLFSSDGELKCGFYDSDGNQYNNFYSGAITIEGNGTTTSNIINVSNGSHTVIFDGINVSANNAAFSVQGAATVYLFLKGENTLIGADIGPSIAVSDDATLVIDVNNGDDGSLITQSDYNYANGIMNDGNIIIQGGTFNFDPTAYVNTEVYVVTHNTSDNTWTVSPCKHINATQTCIGYVCDHCGEIYGEGNDNHVFENGFCNVCGGYESATLNENGYYEISNAGQLYWFTNNLTYDYENFNSANAILTDNIVVNENVLNEDGTLNEANIQNFRMWYPICANIDTNNSSGFQGCFDGNGHTISGLYLDYSDLTTYYADGLFGIIEEEATVKNVGVVDSYIGIGSRHEKYLGGGGIVGRNNGGTVENCYNTGTVKGELSIGGVVGFNLGLVSNCYNSGVISGSQGVGGVIGINEGDVENCYSIGAVSGVEYFGGVIGWNEQTVTNCYYLDTCGASGSGTAVTEEQLKSGEVAYLLGSAFGQEIGKDEFPTFSKMTVYYGYLSCSSKAIMVYTNDENASYTIPDHSYVYVCDTICSACGETITPKSEHNYIYDCDTICTICNNETRPYADHSYVYDCDTQCMFCEEETRPYADHSYVYDCDTQCMFCEEKTRPGAEHNYENHLCACGKTENGWYTLPDADEILNKIDSNAKSFTISHIVAQEGDIITIEFKVINGYRARNLVIIAEDSIIIPHTYIERDYSGEYIKATFIMPAQNITHIEAEALPQSVGPNIEVKQFGKVEITIPSSQFVHSDMYFTIKVDDLSITPIIKITNEIPFPGETELSNIAFSVSQENDIYTVTISREGCEVHCDMIITVILCNHDNKTYKNNVTDHEVTCQDCNYVFTEEHKITPSNVCNCGAEIFSIYGQQLNVGGDLSMKYYVTAFGEGINTKTLKMKFFFLGKETVVSGVYDEKAELYIFTLNNITPQCIGEKIDAHLLFNGEKMVSKLDYSAEDNLLALLEEYENDTILTTLIKDILAYGSAASDYQGYHSMTDHYVGSNREIPDTTVAPSDAFTGYTVVFGYANFLKIRVTLTEGQSLYLDGNDVTDKIVNGIFMTDAIAPNDFNKTLNFEIKNGNDSVQTFAVSINDYISAQKDSEKMGKLVKALYNYGVSAENYAHKLAGENWDGEHIGGTATCLHQKICDICGCKYGTTDSTNHDASLEYDSNGFCANGCYQPAVYNEENHYYEIGNAGQLYWFAYNVNNDSSFRGANAVLTANIVVNENVLAEMEKETPNTEQFRQWTPIGNRSIYYNGKFDGCGHTISGLYFYNPSNGYVGLFGFIDTSCIIQNLGVIDSYFRSAGRLGAIAGHIYSGKINNCYSASSLNSSYAVGGIAGYNLGGTITDCYNIGNITQIEYDRAHAGGIVGENHGTVSNCYNSGTILGDSCFVGGIIGYNALIVTNCYNTGTVIGKSNYVGGIVGVNVVRNVVTDPCVMNCYNIGTVIGNSNYVGSVIGGNDNNNDVYYSQNTYYLIGCAKDGDETVQNGIGNSEEGNTTADTENKTTGKTAEKIASQDFADLLNNGNENGPWEYIEGNDFPTLKA